MSYKTNYGNYICIFINKIINNGKETKSNTKKGNDQST